MVVFCLIVVVLLMVALPLLTGRPTGIVTLFSAGLLFHTLAISLLMKSGILGVSDAQLLSSWTIAVALVAVAILWASQLLRVEDLRAFRTPAVSLIAKLFLLAYLALALVWYVGNPDMALFKLYVGFLPFLMAGYYIGHFMYQREAEKLIRLLMAIMGIVTSFALVEYAIGDEFWSGAGFFDNYLKLSLPDFQYTEGFLGNFYTSLNHRRFVSIFANPLIHGTLTAICLTYAIVYWLQTRGIRPLRAAYILLLGGLGIVSVYFSYSRGALLMLLPVSAYLFFRVGGFGKVLFVLLGIAGLAVNYRYLIHTLSFGDDSALVHITAIRNAWNELPRCVLGCGFGSGYGESYFMGMLVEMGVPAFSLLAGALLLISISMVRARKKVSDPAAISLFTGTLLCLAGLSINSVFSELFGVIRATAVFWILLGVAFRFSESGMDHTAPTALNRRGETT